MIVVDIIFGIVAGFLPIAYAAVGFGLGEVYLWLAAALPAAALVTLLLYAREGRHFAARGISSVLSAVLFCVLGMEGGFMQVFTLFNRAYVSEFGGPNMGDCFGLAFVWLPAAAVMLAVSMGAAALLRKNCNR